MRSSSASWSSTARLRVRISQASRWAVSSRLRTSASTVAATCSEKSRLVALSPRTVSLSVVPSLTAPTALVMP